MADKGFFFCFKSFPWGSLAFFQENFSWKNQFVLDLIVHSFWHTCAIVQKNHTFTVSSILLSEYSFLTPYWFPYNLNQELNAFHIWQKKPPQKKKKKKILSSFLSFCHNPLLRSHSTPSWDAEEQDDQITCLELCRQQAMTVSTDVASQKPGQLFVRMQDRRKYAAAAAKLLQSCPTLCNPRDGSPPGSPIPGILQARTLEWVAISFSKKKV